MFTRLGEQTGQLPVMLQRSATLLSTEVQRRAMALATLLEPLLDPGDGTGGDGDRPGGAASHHPAQPVGEMMFLFATVTSKCHDP